MSEYVATVAWRRDGAVFTDNRYSRAHTWTFDGGVTVPASASPHVVPEPLSVAANVDPEEAFVAAVSSCHMLTFLSIAARKGYVIDSYTDNAVGTMEKNAEGRLAVTRVSLRPRIVFSGDRVPGKAEIETLHEMAHRGCFIANSVLSEIIVEAPET